MRGLTLRDGRVEHRSDLSAPAPAPGELPDDAAVFAEPLAAAFETAEQVALVHGALPLERAGEPGALTALLEL